MFGQNLLRHFKGEMKFDRSIRNYGKIFETEERRGEELERRKEKREKTNDKKQETTVLRNGEWPISSLQTKSELKFGHLIRIYFIERRERRR